MKFSASLITVAVVICSAGQTVESQSPSTAPSLHALDASVEERYVQIQSVGNFPRRPTPVYTEIRRETTVLVPMRDGVRLSTDIYSPVGIEGPLPAVLIRTPYNKNRDGGLGKPGSDAHYFAGHGYHVVVQDMRGRFESEGDYVVSAADRDDGYDTIEWISRQAWSNGKIGTYGCSYRGESQIQLSATRHPSHAAAIPQAAGGGYEGTGRPFMNQDGGVPELASGLGWFSRAGSKYHQKRPPGMSDEEFRNDAALYEPWPHGPAVDFQKLFWHLPSMDILEHAGSPASDYADMFSHGPADPFWEDLNYVDDNDRFNVPALHVNSWYDGGINETLVLFNLFRTNATSDLGRHNQFVIISPTAHCDSERLENWDNAIIGDLAVGDIHKDYFRIYLDWFDHWLKGINNRVTRMPKVQYYAMGINEWRSADRWPLEKTQFQSYYLHSQGDANTRNGDGKLSTTAPVAKESADHYQYDPGNPVPTLGGAICCISEDAAPAGAYDQRDVENRQDVLVYTSNELDKNLEVTGPITATLFVSSSTKDTDFTVKLVDVHPDGTTYNVQDSILRARYREGYEKQVLMQPDGIYRLNIDLHATGNVFLKGHRIRLQVSCSNFPRFVRNLNTGGNNYDETEFVVAKNTIHHSAKYPSHLVLPVVK